MKNQQVMENNKKSALLTMIGVAIMILLTVTKAVPSSNIAGYSVFVGIAFFFIAEAVSKTPNAESGLRFNTIVEDIKKPGVIAWALVPCYSSACCGKSNFRRRICCPCNGTDEFHPVF